MNYENAFWSKVDKRTGEKSCWVWVAGKDKDGYGIFRRKRAHRVAFEMRFGSIDEGKLICHHCDNPSCVRPDHLFQGTALDNKRDSVAKDRHARGDRCWQIKHPEKVIRGEQWQQKYGDRNSATGDRNGSRTCIEKMPRGVDHKLSKLTEEQVREIRMLKENGYSYKTIAALYGLHKSGVWFVVKRKTWKHVA